MNSKRSIWKLVLAGAGFGLLVSNCTVKTTTDAGTAGTAGDTGSAATGNVATGTCTVDTKVNGCTCAGNLVGYQTCLSSGTYGACSCATANGEGGDTSGVAGSSAGGNAGGYVAGDAGNAGEAGAAALHLDPNDCTGCLTQLCAPEWAACSSEDEKNPPDPQAPSQYCLSSGADGSGQIEKIMACITAERAKGLVKRDVVRACGSSIGASADVSFFVWAPVDMTAATEALMNCMADAPDETTPGAWATDAKNFPNGVPAPWSDGTCAKFSCTSAE